MLIGGTVAGALVLGWELLPRRYPSPLTPGPGETALGGWLMIGENGLVSVAVPQLEMGQGITTLLPQIVAEELGADWRQVAALAVPVSELFANVPLALRWAELWLPPFSEAGEAGEGVARHWAEGARFMVTADGMSLDAYEAPARSAAAAARDMLAMAAGRRWGVDWRECSVARGEVRHGARKAGFGSLAADAAGFTPPDPPVLRGASAGAAYPRLDLPGKVDGTARFAADIRLPGMVFAAIRHAPIGEAAGLADYDAKRAADVPGFIALVKGPDWLAATATTWWAAERALGLIAPRFTVHRPIETLRIEAALDKAVREGAAVSIAHVGDPDGVLAQAGSFTQRYDVAPALHAGIETAAATARLRDGRLELWIAAQAPEAARRAAAKALGMGVRDVILYPVPAGGSFDARLEHPHGAEAALIARAAGCPVQLMWSRWQEAAGGVVRPPVAALMSARVGGDGVISAWRMRAALPASAREFGARLLDGAGRAEAARGAGDHGDPLALEGAVPAYEIANLAVEHVPTAIHLPTGRLRGNAHGYTAFFTECFIDELAFGQRHEPLSFRMAMLEGDARLAQCLQRVSALAGWNGGNDGSGAGLACHRMGSVEAGGCIAAIASARRGADGVRVEKISVVADIGRIVNEDIARQQIEGGLVFGIGLALGSSTGYARGLPVTGRLGELGLPRLGDCPEIVVELIASDAASFDPGELGVAVAAPAIANALFSATGLRFRKLPLIGEEE